MKKGLLVLAVTLFLGITLYQAWNYYVRVEQPAALLLTEDALATDNLLALATVNVAHAVKLEQTFLGEPDTSSAGQLDLLDDTTFARFRAAGIDPRHDLNNLVLAFYLDKEQKPAYAAALIGRFDPNRLLNGLQRDYEISADKAGRWPVWRLRRQDVDTCDWSQVWSLYVSRSLILLAEPEQITGLLDRLVEKAPSQRPLTRWRSFRADQLGSLALFVPDATPNTGHPLLQMPLDKAHDKLDVFDEVYFGMGIWPFPVRGRLEVMLAGEDSQAAQRLATEFQTAVDVSKQHWGQWMPTVARLHEALSVNTQDGAVRLSASFDREWVDALSRIPQEIVGLIFGASGIKLHKASKFPGQERIDENPLRFMSTIDGDKLPPYRSEPPFLAEADTVSGPFGIFLSAVEFDTRTNEGLELSISGVHRGIPNLGEGKKRVQLYIERVTDSADNELLRRERCGKERNSLPAELDRPHFNHSARGEKTVRLKPGVRHADIHRIAGRVDLLLPVQTETLKLEAIVDEITVDRDGLRVSLQRSGNDTLSYKVYGDVRRLLTVRGLNTAGQPLSQTSSMSGAFLFGEGASISRSFAGEVVAAELVLATRDVKKSFPFELENIRPKPANRESRHDPVTVAVYSLAQLAKEFASAPPLPNGTEEILAESATGPFRLGLNRLDSSAFGLRTGYTLYAPPIPGLADSLTGLVLEVSSIENAAGKNLLSEVPRREPVRLRQDGTDPALLQGQVAIRSADQPEEAVARIKGYIHLSLPRRVEAVSLDAFEVGARVSRDDGRTVTLSRLDDKGFSLDFGTGRPAVLAVNAYNAKGDAIWVPHPALKHEDERWLGVFPVHGAAARIELLLASEFEEERYPFAMAVGEVD